MEFHYIKQFNSFVNENGYNMTWGGDGGNTGEPWNKGVKGCFSEATLKNMIEKMTGKTHTKETLQLMSEIKMGELNPFYQKTHTPEVIERIRKARTGNPGPNLGRVGIGNPLTKLYLIEYKNEKYAAFGRKERDEMIKYIKKKFNLKYNARIKTKMKITVFKKKNSKNKEK